MKKYQVNSINSIKEKNKDESKNIRTTRLKEVRIGNHSRTSMLLKDMERRDELMWVSKKYETKTKGIVINMEKEDKVEIETHMKSAMKTVYSIPVVHVQVNAKKINESDGV